MDKDTPKVEGKGIQCEEFTLRQHRKRLPFWDAGRGGRSASAFPASLGPVDFHPNILAPQSLFTKSNN